MSKSGGIREAAPTIVKGLVVVIVASLVLTTLMGTFIGDGADEESFEPSTETATKLSTAEDRPAGFSVEPTTGNAVAFSGDGYVEHDAPDNWSNSSLGVCLTAYAGADNEINTNATYSAFAAENASLLIEYHAGDWRAIKFANNNSSVVSTPATEFSETQLCVDWNETSETLTLFENGSEADNATLTTTEPTRQVSNDWLGWLDEVRLMGGVNSSVADTYANDPVNPLTSVDHDARLMFDEGRGDDTRVFYADQQTATIVNGGWTSGVSGPVLEEDVDYVVNVDPLTLRAVEGGYLDGAPIVYVSWTGGSWATYGYGIFGTIVSVLKMLIVVFLVVGAAAAMRAFENYGFN